MGHRTHRRARRSSVIVEQDMGRAPSSGWPIAFAVVLQALPILTFMGLVLGACYLAGYLGVLDLDVTDVASTADYLLASLYGLGAVVTYLLVFWSAFRSGRLLGVRRGALAILGVIIASIALELMIEGPLLEYWLRDPSFHLVARAFYDGYFDYLFAVVTLEVIVIIGLSSGLLSASRRRERQATVVGLVLCATALTYVSFAFGKDSSQRHVMAAVWRPSFRIMLPRYTAEEGDGLPQKCSCGVVPIWTGERASVFQCGRDTIISYGPENVRLHRQKLPNRRSVYVARDPAEIGKHLEASCAANRALQDLARGLGEGELIARDGWPIKLKDRSGRVTIALNCRAGLQFALSEEPPMEIDDALIGSSGGEESGEVYMKVFRMPGAFYVWTPNKKPRPLSEFAFLHLRGAEFDIRPHGAAIRNCLGIPPPIAKAATNDR